MHPDLRPYFDHVWPLFWPWLIWNLLRVADWHTRTGQDGLFMVDCFGNVRLARLADGPGPDDLYSYEAPKQMPWERLGPECDKPACTSDLAEICCIAHPPPLAGEVPSVARRRGLLPRVRGSPLRQPALPPATSPAGGGG